MSGSTRIAQAPLGLGQLWAALVAITLVIVLSAAVALGQIAASKPQAAPAGGAVPVVDRGAMEGPAYNAPDGTGSGGSNGTRFAQ
jgi:hypothetical protein